MKQSNTAAKSAGESLVSLAGLMTLNGKYAVADIRLDAALAIHQRTETVLYRDSVYSAGTDYMRD